MRINLLSLMVCLTSLVSGCGGGNTASQLAKAPDFAPKDQTQCAVVASHAKPLIVEWPSADRGQLEAHVRNQGAVVVEYSGCHMRVLDRCTATAKYAYSPITKKTDHVVMRDADDLYANVPVGAAKLEAKLSKSGQLDVDMTLVGRWETAQGRVRPEELSGDCAGATHVVSAVTVGAFTFTAGADAEVSGDAKVLAAGGGAKSTSKRETLSRDGDEKACDKATLGDRVPPDECGAMIRVEVAPLAGDRASPGAFVGRWSCTLSANVVTAAENARGGGQSERTIVDNGDGTITSTTQVRGVACSHSYVVSGSTATLVAPATCRVPNLVETATSGSMTVTGSTLTATAAGTAVINGSVGGTITASGTCTKL